MLELAKAALDVGLYSNDRDGQLRFWQEQARVPFAELLKVGGGVQQHRHAVGESVLKINHVRDPLAAAPPAGIRRVIVPTDVPEARNLHDPDGNPVRLVPAGPTPALSVELTVSALAAHVDFYGALLPAAPGGVEFRCGASSLHLEEGEVEGDAPQRAIGWRYLTLQVYDVRGAHAMALAAGGREGMAPVRLGEVAHISFVRDPDGNWIELSQRKSITGSLD